MLNILGFLLLAVSAASAFQFQLQTNYTASLVRVCDWFDLQWVGGQAPVSVVFIPSHGVPVNRTVTTTQTDTGAQVQSIKLQSPFAESTPFVIAMSDATGIGTGGISQIYTMVSGDSTDCLPSASAIDFNFYLNANDVQECNHLNITWDNTVQYPLTILAMVPGGQSVALLSEGQLSLDWQAAVPTGSNILFAAFDTYGLRTGGSSMIYEVASGDSSCLGAYELASTPVAALPTGQSSSTTGVAVITITASASTKAGGRHSAADLAGIIVACLASFAIFQAVVLWFCCRRQIKAFLLHRREIRAGRITRPAGDLNMLSTRGATDMDEDVTSQMATTGEVPHPHLWGGSSRGPPSTAGGSQLGDDHLVSPFRDAPVNSLANYVPQNPFETPYEQADHYALTSPTDSAAGRTASDFMSSGDMSAWPSSYNQVWTGTGSGTSSSKAALVAALASTVSSGTGRRTNSSRPSVGRSDDDGQSEAFNMDLPQRAPAGGFRRHEDAGQAVEEDVEDLPPLYKAEWEAGARRERRPSDDQA